MNGITFVLFLVLTTVAIRNASDVIVLNEKPPMPATSVGDQCHRRQYTFRLVQTDASGRQCWDLVNVWACFGVCMSQQIADWKFPHRLSYHPVCMHDGRSKAVAYLRQCDEGVSAETRRYEYVEAVACKCQVGERLVSQFGVNLARYFFSVDLYNEGHAMRGSAIWTGER